MQLDDTFTHPRLGLVTVWSIESWHTIVVVDADGRFFRISGLSIPGFDK